MPLAKHWADWAASSSSSGGAKRQAVQRIWRCPGSRSFFFFFKGGWFLVGEFRGFGEVRFVFGMLNRLTFLVLHRPLAGSFERLLLSVLWEGVTFLL